MKKVIAAVLFTVLVNPSLYGMKRARDPEILQEQIRVHFSTTSAMSEQDYRMLFLCRFQANNPEKIERVFPEERHFLREKFIMKGFAGDDGQDEQL